MTSNIIPIETRTQGHLFVATCNQQELPAQPPLPGPAPRGPKLTPVETRAQDRLFVAHCSLEGLQDRLPLRWPASPDIPPSPKKSYRSHYIHLGWEDLKDPAAWEDLSDFDLALRLIDFTPLRDVLAERLGWTSARGWKPFDPISMFLLHGWQITSGWSRAETLRQLKKTRNADYAQWFGFEDDDYPTEGGLRYWLTALGKHSETGDTIVVDQKRQIEVAIQYLNQLLAQSVYLFVEVGLITPQAWLQALLCPDGMIHDAASRLCCGDVRESCYQETSPDHPRPCLAKQAGRRGCDCDTIACKSSCRRATPRDPEARFIRYKGSNQPQHDNPNQPTDPSQAQKKGEPRYGYRSLPIQLAEYNRRFSVVLLGDFLAASHREENPAAALLRQLEIFYPDLQVDAVAGDAGVGYEVFLHTVYDHLRARRVVDLRADKSDHNKAEWLSRRYDDKGRPICPFGYTLTANGFDYKARRHKWFCGQACRQGADPVVRVEQTIYPPPECPHLERTYGQIVNVGERFKNGSIRLARDVAVGSPEWNRLYHRARNAVEGRNSTLEGWDLKRLPVYGEPRGKAFTFQADVWRNLTTLARLVREASAATGI